MKENIEPSPFLSFYYLNPEYLTANDTNASEPLSRKLSDDYVFFSSHPIKVGEK